MFWAHGASKALENLSSLKLRGIYQKKYPLATVGVRCQTCSTNLALFLTFFGSVLPSSLSPLGAQSARVSEATEILKQLSKNTRSLLWRSGPHGVPKALENLMPLKIWNNYQKNTPSLLWGSGPHGVTRALEYLGPLKFCKKYQKIPPRYCGVLRPNCSTDLVYLCRFFLAQEYRADLDQVAPRALENLRPLKSWKICQKIPPLEIRGHALGLL